MIDKFHQELFGVLIRARPRQSKAASLEQMVTISTHEYNELTNQRSSKAASLIPVGATTRITLKQYQELLINQASRKNRESKAAALYRYENKAQVIHNFINSRR